MVEKKSTTKSTVKRKVTVTLGGNPVSLIGRLPAKGTKDPKLISQSNPPTCASLKPYARGVRWFGGLRGWPPPPTR